MERRCTRALSRPVDPAAPFPPPPVRQNRRFGSRSSRCSAAEKPDLGFCRPKPWRRCPVTAKSEEGLPKRRFCRTSGGGNVTALLLPTDASTVSGGMELDPESCAKQGARTDVSREASGVEAAKCAAGAERAGSGKALRREGGAQGSGRVAARALPRDIDGASRAARVNPMGRSGACMIRRAAGMPRGSAPAGHWGSYAPASSWPNR